MGYELNEADKENPVNAVLQGSPDFKVLGGDRKCTDILFLLLLFLAWFAMTVLGFIVTGAIPSESLEPGDPRRLINGIDYDGRICGVDSEVKDRGKIYFMPSKQGVCVNSCPLTTDYTQFICYDEIYADVIDNATGQVDIVEAWSYVSSGECLYYMPTSDILGYCVFDQVIDLADSAATAVVKEDMASNLNGTGANYSVVSADVSDSDWFKDTCADLYAARSLISGFGFGVSTVVGTAYLFLLRIPAVLSLLVWGLAFMVFALLAAGGVIMSQTSESWAAEEEPRSHSENEIYAIQGMSYTLSVLSVLWCVLMLWLRKSILLAIAITKQAARAVNDMKALVLFPVFQSVALLIFLVPWFIYTVYLASSGEITNHPIETNSGITIPAKTFTYNDNVRYAALYLLFSYFWTSEFIVAIGQIVTAMAIAAWYFTRDKAGNIGTGTVVAAILTSLFYHSGTAAFGSLIMATIKTIRAVVSYFQKKAKDSRNKVVEAILACVQCCLWMLEKCMRFLNKNAYVQTAIFGDNFCMAAKKAFYLIARNVTRVAAVGIVADIVLMLGNVLIPLVSTLLFYVVADATMSEELHGLVAVSAIVFLLSLFVGSLFTEVFGMAISTILQCCIADEEMFKGDDRFGEGDLGVMLDQASDHHADTSGGKVAAVEH